MKPDSVKMQLALIIVAFIPFGIVISDIAPKADNQDTIGQGDYVILLHGMGRTKWSMRKVEKQLSLRGFRVVNVAYPSTKEPIETLANKCLKGIDPWTFIRCPSERCPCAGLP